MHLTFRSAHKNTHHYFIPFALATGGCSCYCCKSKVQCTRNTHTHTHIRCYFRLLIRWTVALNRCQRAIEWCRKNESKGSMAFDFLIQFSLKCIHIRCTIFLPSNVYINMSYDAHQVCENYSRSFTLSYVLLDSFPFSLGCLSHRHRVSVVRVLSSEKCLKMHSHDKK